MEPLDEAQCRRILEVAPEASLEEISQAWHRLRHLHGNDRAMAPAMDEFSPEARRRVLEQIEAAYALLSATGPPAHPEAAAKSPAPAPAPTPAAAVPAAATVLGRARSAAGLSLDQVAGETRVRRDYLLALEEERFDQLRLPTVNVRGYLTAYVAAVGGSVEEIVPAYMARFLQWQARTRPAS